MEKEAVETPSNQRLRAPYRGHSLHVVLVEPEIPPNTGNIARLCAATRTTLHLVHPLGFDVSQKAVRRAGLDYWHLVEVVEHADFDAFVAHLSEQARLHFFSGKASKSFLQARYQDGDYLVFGKESTGLSEELLKDYAPHLVGIPTLGAVRSLNLANAVALGVYEALRQTGRLDEIELKAKDDA